MVWSGTSGWTSVLKFTPVTEVSGSTRSTGTVNLPRVMWKNMDESWDWTDTLGACRADGLRYSRPGKGVSPRRHLRLSSPHRAKGP